MNDGLQARNFLLLPQFISRQRAQALAKSLAQQHAATPLASDTLVPGAPAVYDFLPFVRLLVEKIPQVEAVSEEKVLPTYTYARLYSHGEALRVHEDRDACELSLTLNLDADEPWPIWRCCQCADSRPIGAGQPPPAAVCGRAGKRAQCRFL